MRYKLDTVRAFCQSAFEKAGLAPEQAAICADSLTLSDARGVATHGVTHLKVYCDRLENGTVDPNGDVEFRRVAPSLLLCDANRSAGMWAGARVMEECLLVAREEGSCFAAVKNGCHYGFGAYFPMMAAREGMIGVCFTNTAGIVAPTGGADPMMGTNPISVAIPAGEYPDVVLDMATSLVAKGKITLALKEGRSIPEGWALDPEGNPTSDPEAANRGVLLPAGGAKGYGLALVISLLCSALAGGDFDTSIPRFWEKPLEKTNIGFFMGAMDVEKFLPLEQFRMNVDDIIRAVKSSRPAPGITEVMIPGEIERRETIKAQNEGLELSEATIKDFRELSQRYKIDWPF